MSEVLSQESAEKELQSLYDYYEIEKESLQQESLMALETLEPVLIKGLRKGLIQFKNEDGLKIIQKLKNGAEIVYKELNGEAKIAMDKKPDHESAGKCYALLGSLSSLGENGIKKLSGPDLKRAEHIGSILLFC